MFMANEAFRSREKSKKLWETCGVEFSNDQIVWQDYNAYPKGASSIGSRSSCQFDRRLAAPNKNRSTKTTLAVSGLQQLLFTFRATWPSWARRS